MRLENHTTSLCIVVTMKYNLQQMPLSSGEILFESYSQINLLIKLKVVNFIWHI